MVGTVRRWLNVAMLAAVAAGLVAVSAQARQLEYTESGTAPDQFPLGYPVPVPVASSAPVDGFRTYASLDAQLQGIAAANPNILARIVGQTIEGRDIVAYQLSDADNRTASGDADEAAVLFNGGIHAREWASPEVTAAVIEHVHAETGQGGIADYLLDNTNLLVIPVLNVDGFLHTQRTPARVLESTFTQEDPPNRWPRDGRMRRKNKPGVDDALATEGDGLFGIDLNRNNNPFWARSNRSSSATRSIVYHGTAAASEPETRALQAAAALGPESALSFYVDIHSFSRVLFGSNTGNSRRDAVARRLASNIGAVGGGYGYDPSPVGAGIGTTEEYFSYTYQIPAYTLEIEPTPNGGRDYGGNGVSHDGFILPDSEIARVRDSLSAALLLGAYVQSAPPRMVSLRIERDAGGAVFAGQWQPSAGGRSLQATRTAPLDAGQRYAATIQFDRPMRARNAAGTVVQYAGQTAVLTPSLRLQGVDTNGAAFDLALSPVTASWQHSGARYADDTWVAVFDAPDDPALNAPQRLALAVDAQDLAERRLDANPATIATWRSGGWQGLEDGDGAQRDVGGTDRSMRLIDDGAPLFPSASSGSGGGSGSSGATGPTTLILLLLAALLAGFRVSSWQLQRAGVRHRSWPRRTARGRIRVHSA